MVRLFHRTFNMSMIPIKYSEGFNPHPKFSIGNPLSLGVESEEEYMDIEMDKEMDIDEFIERMNNALPEDIQILRAAFLEKAPAVSSMIEWSFYELKFMIESEIDLNELSRIIQLWLEKDQILMKKMKKKGKGKVEVDVDIKPLIGNLVVKEKNEDGFIVLNSLLKSGEHGNLKPINFLETMERDLSIGMDLESIMLKRLGQYAQEDSQIYKPL